jgi:hypothetical protein
MKRIWIYAYLYQTGKNAYRIFATFFETDNRYILLFIQISVPTLASTARTVWTLFSMRPVCTPT